MPKTARRRGYVTAPDRAGFALVAGGMVGGVFAAGLVVADGGAPVEIAAGFLAGTLVTTLAAVALGGPLWMLCHALGRRGPSMAAALGAAAGFALFLGGQTGGFGLFALPPGDGATFYRWLSALATSVLLAPVAAVVALAMWRVAYRRG